MTAQQLQCYLFSCVYLRQKKAISLKSIKITPFVQQYDNKSSQINKAYFKNIRKSTHDTIRKV